MKKIEAIIRKTKFEEVKEALHENGIEFFSFWEARGVGMAAAVCPLLGDQGDIDVVVGAQAHRAA